MSGLLRRLRATVGLGFIWAVGGAGVGALIELVHNIWPTAIGSMVDIWPAMLAIPAFIGGIVFSSALTVIARNRRFDELSVARFGLLGAVAGGVVSLIPAAFVLAGLATDVSVWYVTARLAGPFALSGALLASGTLAVARIGEDQALLDESDEVAAVGLDPDEARELLG